MLLVATRAIAAGEALTRDYSLVALIYGLDLPRARVRLGSLTLTLTLTQTLALALAAQTPGATPPARTLTLSLTGPITGTISLTLALTRDFSQVRYRYVA